MNFLCRRGFFARKCQGGSVIYRQEFRRLWAASDFARGGSSSQSPLHSVSAWRRKLRSFPCSSSSRQTRCAGLRREQRGIGQNAAGDAADGLRLRCAPPRSIGPPPYPLCRFTTSPPDRGSRPPDPHYGGYPLDVVRPFRRAIPGVLGRHSVRPHWGPEREENWDWCGFIPAPAASEPTLPARFPT